MTPFDRRDFKSERYNNNQPERDFAGHTGHSTIQVVNMVFREPVHQILEKIKNELYFKGLNKMGGNPSKRNQGLYCQYHQDRGHITEDCKTLCDYLEQLVKVGKLKQFFYQPSAQRGQAGPVYQRKNPLKPSLGTINVILATPGRMGMHSSEVMSVSSSHTKDPVPEPKRRKMQA